MFCNRCGNKLADGDMFCNQCGSPRKTADKTPAASKADSKSRGRVRLIAMICVAAVCVAGVGALVVTLGGDRIMEAVSAYAPGDSAGASSAQDEGSASTPTKPEPTASATEPPAAFSPDDLASPSANNGAEEDAPMESEEITVIRVNQDEHTGLFDYTGKEILPVEYASITEINEDGLTSIKVNGKWGAIDTSGKEALPFIYDSTIDFNDDGIASVRINGKWGAIDANGEEVIPFIYDSFSNFNEEGIASVIKNKKSGFINTTGEEIIPIVYDSVSAIMNINLIEVEVDGKRGVIDGSGKEVLPPLYDGFRFAYTDEDDPIGVLQDGKWGVIDTTGKEIVSFVYDDIGGFHEGFASVSLKGMSGYIDSAGREIVPPIYESAWAFKDGLALVSTDMDSEWGFIDTTGKEVIPLIYNMEAGAMYFSEGFAVASKDEKHGIIDKTGREVVPLVYDYVQGFCEGLALVTQNGKCGYVDQTGNEVIPLVFDTAEDFNNGYARVSQNGAGGMIDKTGKMITQYAYDSANPFQNGFATVGRDGKATVIDSTGKEIIPLMYDYAFPDTISSDTLLIQAMDGRYGIADLTGHIEWTEFSGAYEFTEENVLEDATVALWDYYMSYLMAINEQNAYHLNNVTPEHAERMEERIFSDLNSRNTFELQQIVLDLDTVVIDEGASPPTVEFAALFQYEYTPRSGGELSSGAIMQQIHMVFDEIGQNWIVDDSTLMQGIALGENQLIMERRDG